MPFYVRNVPTVPTVPRYRRYKLVSLNLFRDSLQRVDICASLLLWALEVVMTSKWSKMVLKRLQLIQHQEVGLGIPGVRRCILAQVLSKDLAKRAQVPL